jgi:predicted metallopeptidase
MVKKKKGGKLKYVPAPDLQERMEEIVALLGMTHIKPGRVKCLRSYGSSSRYTIARCHALGKLMQHAMETKAFYAIEFLELFDKQSKVDQDKTIIHELMHIPKSFGGGFRHHDYVCEKNVDIMHEKFESLKMKEPVTFESVKKDIRWF